MTDEEIKPAGETASTEPAVVMLPGRPFVLACFFVAGFVLVVGQFRTLPVWLLAAEVNHLRP